MKKLLAGVIVIALVTPWFAFGQGTLQKAAPSKNASVEKELINLKERWKDACVKGDVAFLDRILAEDFVDTGTGGEVYTKAQVIAWLRSGDNKVISSVDDDYKVHIYGQAAVLTGHCTFKVQEQGKDISGQYRWTDTYVKRAGHWQCVASQGTEIAEKK